jgi:LPXTG-motif cell wall-anchored protein
MYRSVAIVAATLLALAALLPAFAADTVTVSMKDFKFEPKTITVRVGDTVTWKNDDQAPHTAQADDGSFDSDDMGAGQSFSFTATKAGTFPYYCEYHGGPNGAGMAGTLVVQEAAAQPQPTTAPAAAATPTGTIQVADQRVVNNTITVAKATISQDGWIAVHKAGPDGQLLLTPLVGIAPINAGDNANVVVTLTEPVAAGAPLWPMLHIDAGAIGAYEFPGGPDVPVVANGMPVMQQIAVQGAGGPAQLPNTGGQDAPLGLLVGAGLLLLGGALLLQRRQRG